MAATDFQSLLTLIDNEIPDGRKSLQENYSNLERVAKYCESNYLQASDKRKALEETKNYTTHSLASVAYQVNQLASSFLRLLSLQQSHLAGMESSVNHLNQIVMIHKEKVARREIGVLTTNRTACRPLGVKSGILFPEQTERPVKYTRKAIDYSSLDDIGHGVRPQSQQSNTPRTGRSPSVSSSSSGSQAPTTRPPTPPQYRHGNQGGGGGGGTLGRASGASTASAGGGGSGGHYRSIPPPSVPAGSSTSLPQTPTSAAPSPGQHSPGNNNQGVAGSRASQQSSNYGAPMVQMGQVRVPHGMMGRAGSQMGRDSLMMMGPGGAMMSHQQMMGGPQGGGGPGQEMGMMGYPGGPPRGSKAGGPGGGGPGGMHMQQGPGVMLPGHETMDMPPPPPQADRSGSMLLEASPPLPPPPESGVAFDYNQMAPLPPPEFSDRGGDGDFNHGQNAPEDPYAATGPGFLGPDEFMPATYLEKVVAIYDYEADKEDELTFSENSVIYVIRKNDDGWWEGVMDGVTGLFPSNYVEPCM